MTRTEQENQIREACIKANPGIELLPRVFPIHLADVLLAVPKKRYLTCNCDGFFSEEYETATGIEWKLRQDSLADQSDETIAFLHSLLTNK